MTLPTTPAPPERPPAAAPSPPRSVERGLGIATGSFAVSAAVGLVGSIVTSRLYGIGVIGDYGLVSVPYVVVTQLSTLSEQTAFVQRSAGSAPHDPALSRLFRSMLVFSTVLTAALAAVAAVISAAVFHGPIGRPDLVVPTVAVLAGYTCLDNVGWNMDTVFSTFRDAETLFVVRSTQLFAFLIGAVALHAVAPSVWGLVLATCLSFAVPLLSRLRRLPRYIDLRHPRSDGDAGVRDLLRFGLVLAPAQLLGGVVSQAGTWVVAAIGTPVATGGYARALGLASRLSDANYRLSEILMPGLAERRRRGDVDGALGLLRTTVRRTASALATLVGPAGGAAAGILAVYGSGFPSAATALAWLMGAYGISVLTGLHGQDFIARGRPGITSALTTIRCVLTIVLTVALLPLGASGVAAAYALGYVVSYLLGDHVLTERRSLLGWGTIGRVAATWATGHVVAMLVLGGRATFGRGVLAFTAGVAAAAAIAAATGLVTADDRAGLRRALRRKAAP